MVVGLIESFVLPESSSASVGSRTSRLEARVMVHGLERWQECGDVHFVTFSCFHRCNYLESAAARDLFEDALQKARTRYRFDVLGYVVMPEHVHLLVSEPVCGLLAGALKWLKLSVSRRARTQ